MNPEAQRIAIAEACGWTTHQCANDTRIHWWFPPGFNRDYVRAVEYPPDFPNDLNAMAEAEVIFWDGQHEYDKTTYQNWLIRLSGGGFHVSAAQRAEAFLKTTDRWKENA